MPSLVRTGYRVSFKITFVITDHDFPALFDGCVMEMLNENTKDFFADVGSCGKEPLMMVERLASCVGNAEYVVRENQNQLSS